MQRLSNLRLLFPEYSGSFPEGARMSRRPMAAVRRVPIMSVSELIVVGLGLSVAGLIKGITGIGFLDYPSVSAAQCVALST